MLDVDGAENLFESDKSPFVYKLKAGHGKRLRSKSVLGRLQEHPLWQTVLVDRRSDKLKNFSNTCNKGLGMWNVNNHVLPDGTNISILKVNF